jgi:selenocysteine lyase/cysteine desulfurase
MNRQEGVGFALRQTLWHHRPGLLRPARAPTVVFTLEGYTPRQVAERLGQEGIFLTRVDLLSVSLRQCLPAR